MTKTISGKNARLFILPSCECGSPMPKYCFCPTCARLRERQVEIKGVQGFEFRTDAPKNRFTHAFDAFEYLKSGVGFSSNWEARGKLRRGKQ